MKSRFPRRTALAAALVAPALVACGGFNAQTDQVYQAAQGVNDRSGDIEILNAVVVAAEDGSGTFAGGLLNETDSPQSLTSVTGTGLTLNAPSTPLPAHQLVSLARPNTDGSAQLTVTGSGVKPGSLVRLTFTFSGGGSTTIAVPVVSTDSEDGSEYANVPLPRPTPTATPTAPNVGRGGGIGQ